jgi:DNA-binding MarR family transcriptional regulator
MSVGDTEAADRERQIERIAADLMPRAAQLTRLLLRRVDDDLTRTEAGVLRSLLDGPRRITELADLEGLAQPTVTVLVKRLEERGYAQRARDADDGRVALISITEPGREALEQLRAHYRAALAEELHVLGEGDIARLDAATESLGRLIAQLRGR